MDNKASKLDENERREGLSKALKGMSDNT
jgi:hypothetical protein